MLKINIFNQYDEVKDYKKIIKYILKKAYKTLNLKEKMVINIILVDNVKIQELNNEFRNLDKPTDVLSFANDSYDNEIGDVFISLDKTKEQAIAYGHSFARELAFLATHGFLHSLGYDHLNKADELEMFALQDEILENTIYRRSS